ncbi:MAG: Mur ligase family protein [Rhodobacterales bacterium]|nr:Mur ligase family protein [Rhodobacterales bacterium]
MTRSLWLKDALQIPLPDDAALVLDGCRRLLGPNLFSASPGAVGDALCPGRDPDPVLQVWLDQVRGLLDELGWRDACLTGRRFDGGASLFLAAPVDRLFSAAYVIEAGWHFTACGFLGVTPMPRDPLLADLRAILAHEANPAFAALVTQGENRGIDRLLDDDLVTFGHGKSSVTWDIDQLPATPDWQGIHDLPLALVTGTNGKTTTTRLIAAMGAEAGLVSGLSSTEFVRVGDEILDHGDYSGPAGARLLLRDKRLELAVLEVARGGILRRGLPVTHAQVAVVTNVAADHLGQYGIMTVDDLAQVKLSVHRALRPGGTLVLNADNPFVVSAAPARLNATWFSLSPDTAQIQSARAKGNPCGWYEGGMLKLSDGSTDTVLIDARDVPLTLGGAARYNIENALAAALAARALGLADDAIRAVLARFRSDPRDNPGRANEFAFNGARVFVDYAHNPHSIAAIASALAALPAERRFILLSHAGDRSDDEIRALVTGAFDLSPDVAVVAENPKFLRGRAPGALPALMRTRCLELGLNPSAILDAPTPGDGTRRILDALQPGDLALLLVHDDRERIFAMLAETAVPTRI